MIDGFKFKITNQVCIKSILTHPEINFDLSFSERTGEIYQSIKRAKYKTLTIECKYDKQIFISGNLFKYYHGRSNSENFNIKDALQALNQLIEVLGIDPTRIEIMRLEWGLNITLPLNISVNSFLENILVYKGKILSNINYGNEGVMRRLELTQFHLKIYDKGTQQKLKNNLLRVELVSRKKGFLQNSSIYFVSDLFNKKNQKKLNHQLIRIIEHLIFCDHILTNNLTRRQANYFRKHSTATYWNQLIKNSPESYRKSKIIFRKRLERLSGINWNKFLKEAIIDTSKKLLE